MTADKYERYFTTECVKPDHQNPGTYLSSTRSLADFGGGELSIDLIYLTAPRQVLTRPHKHDFAQYLSFFSTSMTDARDFDAEIELTLGEEMEKHVISCPTSVYVPAGMMHGPLEFKRVGKPVLFLDIALAREYSRVGNTPD